MHSYHFEYWFTDGCYKGTVVELKDATVSGETKEEVRQKLYECVFKSKKMGSQKKIWTGWLVKEGWKREAFWVRDGWGGVNPNPDDF